MGARPASRMCGGIVSGRLSARRRSGAAARWRWGIRLIKRLHFIRCSGNISIDSLKFHGENASSEENAISQQCELARLTVLNRITWRAKSPYREERISAVGGKSAAVMLAPTGKCACAYIVRIMRIARTIATLKKSLLPLISAGEREWRCGNERVALA